MVESVVTGRTPEAALPGATFGQYVVSQVLGAGAMGVVYRAEDTVHGGEVALKTVTPRQQSHLSTIRREILTLKRFSHPGVVRIITDGITDGLPWYAMELLEGETLRGRITEFAAVDTETTQNPALRLAARICSILSFLQGEGVVHGDLKPDNVFLRTDEEPVLVDFGLAWNVPGRVSREVLGNPEGVAGTPDYMAPEQILGDPIDARTDLYAVGCMLFELLTGRAPFASDDGRQTLHGHLFLAPPRLSRAIPHCPPRLEALVLGLLAKRPRDRIGHPDDVLEELAGLGVRMPVPHGDRAPMMLYRPPLLGRDAIFRELVDASKNLARGGGRCILLRGESGIGKTYIASELVRRIGDDSATLTASCTRVGEEPLQSLRALLRALADLCVQGGAEAYRRLLGANGRVLELYEPALLGLPGSGDYPAPPIMSGPGAREHLFACLTAAIESLAGQKPLVMVIDDLQWADELTLAFLGTRADDWYRRVPLFLLATVRLDEGSAALDQLLGRRDVRAFDILGLAENDIRSLVREMLALEAPPLSLARFLTRRSHGNPFFVAEYLRAAVGDGVLRRASGSLRVGTGDIASDDALEALPFPATVHDLVARRIDRLDDRSRALIELCSVLGREFDEQTLEAAAASLLGETERMEAMSELLARQFVEQRAPQRFRFLHDQLNEIAYRSIPQARRRSLHATVATALERHQAPESIEPEDLGTLAHHWQEADEPARAIVYLDRAGFHALDAAAYADAAGFLRRALVLAESVGEGRPARRGDVVKWQSGIARAEHGLGDLAAAERHASVALATLGYRVPRAIHGWTALVAREALRQCSHLGGMYRHVSGERQRECRWAAQAAVVLTYQYFYLDNALGVLATSLVAVNLAEKAGCVNEVPRGYVALATVVGLLRLPLLAERFFQIGETGAVKSNDVVEFVYCRATEAVYFCTFGQWKRADEAARDAERSLVDVNDSFLREMVWTIKSHIRYFTGKLDESLEGFRRVLVSATEHGNLQHKAWAHFSIGRSLEALGRFEEALPMLENARVMLAARPELQSEIICCGLLASVRLRLGDRDGALRAAEETIELTRNSVAVGFVTLVGYRSAIDVFLELSSDATFLSSQPTLERSLRRALRAFGRFARVIPVASPARWLCLGRLAELEGRAVAARHAFDRSLSDAIRLEMPIEIGRAHLALGDLEQLDAGQRRRHLDAAREIFRRTGSDHFLRRTISLGSGDVAGQHTSVIQ